MTTKKSNYKNKVRVSPKVCRKIKRAKLLGNSNLIIRCNKMHTGLYANGTFISSLSADDIVALVNKGVGYE